jgi:hypothetical protein
MNEPKCRYIYSPVQIAECGGPCQQGPEHCDCGELWVTETKPEAPTDEELSDLWSWSAGQDQGSWPTQQHCFARAVLARWGNHPEFSDSSAQSS